MELNSRIKYHLGELEIARDPTKDGHIMPVFRSTDRRILDVGCGIGQTLIAANLPDYCTIVGVDIERNPLSYGHTNFKRMHFVNCTAEKLPFADDSFDCVVSRVALPYTNIPLALAEMHRVLVDGGHIWCTLHPVSKTRRQLLQTLRSLKLKDMLFRSYVFFNGLLLQLFSKLLPFPANGNYESFQTQGAMQSCLMRAGFDEIAFDTSNRFLVTAIKITKPVA